MRRYHLGINEADSSQNTYAAVQLFCVPTLFPSMQSYTCAFVLFRRHCTAFQTVGGVGCGRYIACANASKSTCSICNENPEPLGNWRDSSEESSLKNLTRYEIRLSDTPPPRICHTIEVPITNRAILRVHTEFNLLQLTGSVAVCPKCTPCIYTSLSFEIKFNPRRGFYLTLHNIVKAVRAASSHIT